MKSRWFLLGAVVGFILLLFKLHRASAGSSGNGFGPGSGALSPVDSGTGYGGSSSGGNCGCASILSLPSPTSSAPIITALAGRKLSFGGAVTSRPASYPPPVANTEASNEYWGIR